MLRIIGLSRIHITLFDMEGKHGRIDGGMGIGLKRPRIVLRSGDCTNLNIRGLSTVSFCIEEDYEEHIGLGHTTQFLLSAAKLHSELNLEKMSAVELASKVGRGGTSGVGVHLFDNGGFVVDGGHSTRIKHIPLPSDFSNAPPPPLLLRVNFPWYIYVNVPNGGKIFGSTELDIFRKYSPSQIGELTRVVLMEFIPSVVEKDISSALDGLWKIQGLGFKKVEVELQSNEVKDMMIKLYKNGFPSGLSSFGPAIFTFTATRREGEELVSRFGGWLTEPNNRGVDVEWS
ncbi:beta-ribofuranosylaminobenzene 5'-phosphate synthase [Metallosphaera tengchongensis]|uniref:Beta-ribofuranosylaminobenzene 5'-phosphate synthase n=1 Tax=Metallosphaera tengchongensis TaxID=1532350 RepID=A0A6N0NUX4_9CREN|nr:beta-ribofuranosylaminobenzene 5'-phosphate synthase family protein [Metallosphaera tengchongensis]QKQ99287.1 beta-ribofuranosylaminobenzene 5'-phosphate synthase [Metallosphaera tengchongensis]